MTAQDELKTLFLQLDEHSDKALAGLREVRSGSKNVALRPSPFLSAAPLVLTVCVLGFLIF